MTSVILPLATALVWATAIILSWLGLNPYLSMIMVSSFVHVLLLNFKSLKSFISGIAGTSVISLFLETVALVLLAIVLWHAGMLLLSGYLIGIAVASSVILFHFGYFKKGRNGGKAVRLLRGKENL